MIDQINVAITCIGSGVAQSVLNSCRISSLPLKTFGFGSNPMAFGSFDSDHRDFLPLIYDRHYPEKLLQKCLEHQIDILIPTLDYEVNVIANYREMFEKEGIRMIISAPEITAFCNDKLKMSSHFNNLRHLFCRTYTKDSVGKALQEGEVQLPLIAKPNSGFASRGIKIINEKQQIAFLDDESIIQEMALPLPEDPDYRNIMNQIQKGVNPQLSEISFQIVIDQDGSLAGRMVSRNKLQNGVPVEIIPFESPSLWDELDDLINELIKRGHRGPLNLQGRITPGGLKIFEMNARFTGLTYMRAMLGFNEVEACIKSFGNLPFPPTPLKILHERMGMRQVADKVVHTDRDEYVKKLYLKLNNLHSPERKKILITGAGGYLGRNLITRLCRDRQYEIIALSSDKNKIEGYFQDLPVKCYSIQDYMEGVLSPGNVDLLIHCAFGRPHYNKEDIADSLEFTNRIFIDAAIYQLPEIINISSQSVYGDVSFNKTEQDNVQPVTAYGQAKYASELMLANIKRFSPHTFFTSIRFASLRGAQPGYVDNDILSKLVSQVMKGHNIRISNKETSIERLDIRDAVSAVIALLKIDPAYRSNVYNIGSGKAYPIEKLAKTINAMVAEKLQIPEVKIEFDNEKAYFKQGLNSTLFSRDTGWKTAYDLHDTVLSVIEYHKRNYTSKI